MDYWKDSGFGDRHGDMIDTDLCGHEVMEERLEELVEGGFAGFFGGDFFVNK